MSYLGNHNRIDENLKEENRNQTNTQNESHLYNKYTANVANERFQRSAEGVPALSAEDFQVIRNCNKESFWYRCLPLSCSVCALMFVWAKQKSQTPKVWHIMSGAFLGWFAGKASYRRTCEDRLINSSSQSPFVTAMRRRRGIVREMDPNVGSSEMSDTTDQYWDSQSSTPDNVFDYGSNEFANYKEENFQQKGDNEDLNQFTTYDDLRAKNRALFKPTNPSRPYNS